MSQSVADMIPFVGENRKNIVFAGRDASRALAQSSLKEDQCRPDWYDLTDDQKKVLSDWFTFFSKRYNIKGKVEGAENTGAEQEEEMKKWYKNEVKNEDE